MTEREINDFCKENKLDIEEFKSCRFILKYPEKLKQFIDKQQQKFERELLNQKGLFQ
jgi:protein associated with RNAse G/E